MAMIKETWVVDKPLAVVLWVSRLYGIVPLRFRSTRTTTVAYVSRPLYYLGVVFTTLLNLFAIADLIYVPEAVAGPTADPKSSKNSNRILAVAIILITLTATIYCTLYSIYKMKKYLQLTSEINEIKNSLKYSYTSGLKLRHAICLLTLFILELCAVPLVGYVENGELHQYSSMIANLTLYGSLGMMALHFVFVAFHINSSLEVINKCLLDVLSEISRESASSHDSNLRLLSRNEISFSYIKITSINKAIDLLGKVKQDVKMTPRMKLAREIHTLSSSFVRTCEVLRDLNDTENIILLVHVVVITMYLVITLNNLVQTVCCTTDVKYIIIVITIQCVWFVCHTFRIVLIVEPCHRIQEELSQTKMLVARIMCEVIYETDPLYDATDNFFKQLHLNDVSISVMGIFSLGRSTISTIIGGATTLYVVLLEL